jgi:hypothetical protein
MSPVLQSASLRRGALAVAAVSIVGTSVALAASNGGSKILACAAKRTGALRVRADGSHCEADERSLSWNAVGPRGLPGRQGPRGLQGVKGATGPSSARIAYTNSGQSGVSATNGANYQTIVTMPNLAPGTYELTGTAIITFSSVTHGVDFQCILSGPSGPPQAGLYDQSTGPDQNGFGPTLTPVMITFATVGTSTDVSFGCRGQTSDTGVTWSAQSAEIVARAVGSVSSQQVNSTPPPIAKR